MSQEAQTEVAERARPNAPRLPRRRPVKRHPGIYYRPRRDGKVGPPYEIRYLDSTGKHRWDVVHGNLEAAEARRAELRLRRRRGERIEPTRQTFDRYAAEWLERQNVRPRTLEIYGWALRKHLIPYFGRRRLDQIHAEDVAGFIALMQRTEYAPGKRYKKSTIEKALQPLRMILTQAARKGRISVNPISQLERAELPSGGDERPKRILSLEEMRALVAKTENEQNRCLLELLLVTGLRIGEALGLIVADLEPQHAVIRVEYQLGRDGSRTPLKTEESRRAIDIPNALMQRLLTLTEAGGGPVSPHAFVFASRAGTGLERKVVRRALDRAVAAAKLAPPKPTLHDLRHTHASMLIGLEYNLVDIQRRLGHRSPDTTLKLYAHQWKYRDAQRSQIGAQLGQLLSRQTEPVFGLPEQARRVALPAAALPRA